MSDDRIRELEAAFDLRWDADQRAMRMWQEAHPGADHVWPDHTDLCLWLMGEVARLRSALRVRQQAAEADDPKNWVTSEGLSDQEYLTLIFKHQEATSR